MSEKKSTGLKEAMASMTWKERIDHLWTYYKWVPAVAVAVIVIICCTVSSVLNRQVETLYSGTLVNVNVTDEGKSYLTDEWFKALGGEGEKQKVELMSACFQDLLTTSNPEMDSAAAMQVTAMVVAQSLDYVIMEDIGMNYYKNQTVFASLDDIFTPEQLAQIEGAIIYHQDGEEGREYPIAIDITEAAFVQECVQGNGKVYIAFPGNTTRTERNDDFLEHILNWEPNK